MCVIVCNEKGRIPTVQELINCRESNPDGIGVAWKTSRGIKFEKGISFARMLDLLNNIKRHKMAYLLHFRITTMGGQGPRFCHPFPVTNNRSLMFATSGLTRGVLAHNGTWSDWKEQFNNKQLIDRLQKERWSDSAVMAWLLGKGRTFKVPKYGQRVVTLDATNGLHFYGNWTTREDGIHFSNMFWEYSGYTWSKWMEDDEAKSLAREPEPTVCDLEAARKQGKISKRKFNRMKARIDAANLYADKHARDEAYNYSSKTKVWCEYCGNKFFASVARCPVCYQGEGMFQKPLWMEGTNFDDDSVNLNDTAYNDEALKRMAKEYVDLGRDSTVEIPKKTGMEEMVNTAMTKNMSLSCAGNWHEKCIWDKCSCECKHPDRTETKSYQTPDKIDAKMLYCYGCGLKTNARPCPMCRSQVFSSEEPRRCSHGELLKDDCEKCDESTKEYREYQTKETMRRLEIRKNQVGIRRMSTVSSDTIYCLHAIQLDKPCEFCEKGITTAGVNNNNSLVVIPSENTQPKIGNGVWVNNKYYPVGSEIPTTPVHEDAVTTTYYTPEQMEIIPFDERN